jgi:protein MpaA
MRNNLSVERLGKNFGRYFGEGIQIESILESIRRAAAARGWTLAPQEAAPGLQILFLQRPACLSGESKAKVRKVYISAGIHGDEPAGVLAVLRMLEDDRWPSDTHFWMAPCLNPTGFPLNTRENAAGIDLNRDYLHLSSPETRAHVRWLEQQPRFDLTLCLHEDWEADGFYLYENNPDQGPALSEHIVDAVRVVCPIESATIIDGREASAPGIVRPNLDPRARPQWPEAFFLITNKTRLSYTLEAPSDFPLEVRVRALVAAAQAALSLGHSID